MADIAAPSARTKQVNPTFQEVKQNDQVVFCDLTPLQMAAYEWVMEIPEFQLLQRGEETCYCGRASKEKIKNCCYKWAYRWWRHFA
ncbi:hypothetical protein PsorP6_012302 [Peronosclerospora sorghi]|uniref:Uncharacterized protein n=1 Tax=Peronosclerospora sorghi TaxID=230839 RepID=A0ACC0WEU7_9STRA|nr:hypothetical protein PsorP6_012302 [Peronosclerospora sorghi]